MGWLRPRRTITARAVERRAVIGQPDRFALQIASLGVITNTLSPASAGIHGPTTQPRGFTGDRGYGVNRWAGRTSYPYQRYGAAIVPIADPTAARLGIGAGVAGQPGLPNTGSQTSGLSSLAWLSYSPLGRAGLGG